jgi:ubiquitin-activating enzyme E1
VAVFGRSLQAAVQQQRFFLVGAGAIGCEMLKNWALMGLASAGQGRIHVTDMDTIEKSNLSRQFLFRNSDVGQLKSLTAARVVQRMNPQLEGRVAAQSNRVAPETQDVYDDAFWEQLDGVCTALDNMQARLYVDQRCVRVLLPVLSTAVLCLVCSQ